MQDVIGDMLLYLERILDETPHYDISNIRSITEDLVQISNAPCGLSANNSITMTSLLNSLMQSLVANITEYSSIIANKDVQTNVLDIIDGNFYNYYNIITTNEAENIFQKVLSSSYESLLLFEDMIRATNDEKIAIDYFRSSFLISTKTYTINDNLTIFIDMSIIFSYSISQSNKSEINPSFNQQLPQIAIYASMGNKVNVAAIVLTKLLWQDNREDHSYINTVGAKNDIWNSYELISDILHLAISGNMAKIESTFYVSNTSKLLSFMGNSIEAPLNYTVYCDYGEKAMKNFTCMDSGYVINIECNGIARLYKGK
jgi:hypothetical protein